LVRARRAGNLPPNFPEVRPMVDEDCPAPAYRLGRLFAALEGAQQDALRNLNAGIRDRYYGAASATPAVVFPQLLRKLPHHLKNASRPVYYERLVQQILDGMEAKAFPSTLSLEAQGLFALGYFHQRQALFAKNPEHGSSAPDPAPNAQEV
jgi:CRISPR-associated protein Csd1